MPSLVAEQAVAPRPDRWLELSADIRSSQDLFQFLGPRFNETYRARAWRRAPKPAAALAHSSVGARPLVQERRDRGPRAGRAGRADERRDRAVPARAPAGRRSLHAVRRAAPDPARLPARRTGTRAADGDLREELGQPEQQVADPPDPGAALRLERHPARGGGEPARHPARTDRRHRSAVLRRVVRLAGPPARGVLRARRARSGPPVRPLRVLCALDGTVGGRLRALLGGGDAIARRPARRDPGARPPASEAARGVARSGSLRCAGPGRVSAPGARADRSRDEVRLLRLAPPQRRRSSA